MLSSNHNQYVFSVDMNSTKRNVKDAVQNAFGVTVLNVNTFIVKPKSKRDRMRRNRLGHTSYIKKAIVKLKAGDAIDLA
jgi:large subunit ribosomal protein L23